ncbi:MAG: hypothetical protein KC800_22530, partial [Candidatus Eremiobacteraeota bacterium]|nr:hypothetical protein [Candidatus Eremiobacteraeota bacterium]
MGRRGVALIYFLIVMSVVVLLITTIFVTTKRQLFTTTASINSVRAHYVAEAGLAAAIARLEEDPGWTDGFDQEPMPEGPGTYSLRFSSDPITAGPDRSLNNLNSLSALDSYHGANTLPPFSALLVVEGEVGLEKRVLEAVVVLGADVPERSAILASDTITISGGASIDGRLSEHDTDSIPVDVHSNSTASGALVDLTAIDSSGNFISGRATSSGESDASTSVLMPAGGGAAGGTASKLAPKKMPDPNITAILEQHQSEAGPPIPVVPGPLSLSGNNYYSGDVTIQGDLYLENDAKLFVQGDLKINGSIRGHGALVVGGNTVLHGSADLTPGENDFVSLMSGGHVVMEGFNGQEYLENLRDTDPAARKKLEDMEFAIQEMQSFLPLFDESGSQPMNSDRTFNQRIDGLQAIVSNHPWAE